MAVTDQQKLDFLLKKIGYTKTKTGSVVGTGAISGTPKQPFAEAIPSPLIIANGALWNEADSIPATPPAADTNQVKVYLAATSGLRMTADATSSGQRAYIAYSTYGNTSSTRLTNWIDTQFGASYIIKVYKGDPNSGGVNLSAAGSGADDGWFFDYSAGVLNFNDTSVPSGVTDTNIYIVGYRYVGQTGAPTSGISTFSYLDLTVERNLDVGVQGGISTFRHNVQLLDNDKLQFGDSQDLEIFHSGSHSFIDDTGTGNLYVRGNQIQVTNAGFKASAIFNPDSHTALYYNGSEKIRTTDTGINVTGDGVFTGNVSIGGTLTYEDVVNVDSVGIITAQAGIRVTGGVIEAQAGENKIPSLYAAMGNLPSAGSYHGMFAHVHATGRGYFAHAGNWLELVNKEVNGVVGTGTERYNIGPVDLTTLDVSGISTYAGNVDINAQLDVSGQASLSGFTTTTSYGLTTRDLYTSGITTVHKAFRVDGQSIGTGLMPFVVRHGGYQGIQTSLFTSTLNNYPELVLENTWNGNWNTSGPWKLKWTLPNEQELPAGDGRILSELQPTVNNSGLLSGFRLRATDNSTGLKSVFLFHPYASRFYTTDSSGTTESLRINPTGIGITHSLYHIGNTGVRLYFPGNNNIRFDTNSTERLRIDNTGIVSVFGDLDVDGHTNLDNVSIAGVTTFTGAIDANGDLDVDGHTNLDNVNIVGVTTAAGHILPSADVSYDLGSSSRQWRNLYADNIVSAPGNGFIGPDLTVRNFKATGISTFAGNATFSSTITAGGATGTNGQYLKTTGTGVAWASFPTLRTRQTFTASAGQTTFSFSYNVNFVDVFVNGIKLTDAEFTATNGSSVVLAVGCFVGDIVELVSYNTVSGGGGGGGGSLNNIVEDTTPQLGGDLDIFNKSITGTGNINITGVITATNFVGDGSGLTNVIGSGSGVIVKNSGSTVGTAGTINFGDNLSVSAISAGIVTITGSAGVDTNQFNVNKLDVSGISTFKSDIDVDGHTNLDNVSIAGIATFSKNIILPDSTDTTDGRVKFGASTDMQIFHYSGANYIDVTSTLNIRGPSGGASINIKPKSAEEGIKIIPDGAVELYHNNIKRLETSSVGVSIPQDLDVDGHTNLDNVSIAGVVTATTFKGALEATSASFSSNIDANGDLDVDGHTNLDNVSIAGVVTATTFSGSGASLTNLPAGNLTGILPAISGANLTNLPSQLSTSNMSDNRVVTSSGGVVFNGEANLTFDGSTLNVGTGVTVETNGQATYTGIITAQRFVGALTGNVTGTASEATEFTVSPNNSTDETVYPVFVDGVMGSQGAETDSGLTYNPSTGNLTATKFTGDGSGLTGITASGSGVVIKNSGSTVGTAGTINFGTNLDVSAISGGAVTITGTAGVSTSQFNVNKLNVSGISTFNDDVEFKGSGANILFDASQDQLEFSDSATLTFGNHTGTGDYNISYVNGADFTILGMNGGSGDLVLGTFASGTTTKTLVSKRSNNALELYFANNKKLETTNTGVTVTGTVAATSFSGDGSNLTGISANVGITTNLSGTFTASAGSPSTINTFGYGSGDLVVEYTIYIKNGSDFQTQKLLAMRDGTTIHSTQFAVMFSSSLLVQCDATISSGNILLRATPETGVSGSTTYKIKREVM